MNNIKYFEEINILKGMTIILVLLGHSPVIFPINLQEIYWCKLLVDIIYSFHMPCFFLISGFLFYNSEKKWKNKIK